MSDIVADKRRGQRSLAKKSRRSRHYEKQFIRNMVMRTSQNKYAGSLDTTGELEINISDSQYTCLILNKVQEKVDRGDLVVLPT